MPSPIRQMDFPFLANANQNQNFLNPEWANPDDPTRNVLSWFSLETPITDIEMLHLLSGKNVTELANPHLESIYEVRIGD